MDPAPVYTQDDLITGDILEEFCHKLKHLHRSQTELLQYLAEQADTELAAAVDENAANIVIMCRKIEILKSDLPDTDSRKYLDLCDMQKPQSESRPVPVGVSAIELGGGTDGGAAVDGGAAAAPVSEGSPLGAAVEVTDSGLYL
jgi:hypothetical protein